MNKSAARATVSCHQPIANAQHEPSQVPRGSANLLRLPGRLKSQLWVSRHTSREQQQTPRDERSDRAGRMRSSQITVDDALGLDARHGATAQLIPQSREFAGPPGNLSLALTVRTHLDGDGFAAAAASDIRLDLIRARRPQRHSAVLLDFDDSVGWLSAPVARPAAAQLSKSCRR